VWLISEVFRIGTSASQLEASKLLRDNAEQLTFSENMNTYIWPASIAEAWSTSLPVDARINNLLALYRMLLSRDLAWWKSARGGYLWTIPLLDEVLASELPSSGLKNESAMGVRLLLSTINVSPNAQFSWRGGRKTVSEIRNRVERHRMTNIRILELSKLESQLQIWTSGGPVSRLDDTSRSAGGTS